MYVEPVYDEKKKCWWVPCPQCGHRAEMQTKFEYFCKHCKFIIPKPYGELVGYNTLKKIPKVEDK